VLQADLFLAVIFQEDFADWELYAILAISRHHPNMVLWVVWVVWVGSHLSIPSIAVVHLHTLLHLLQDPSLQKVKGSHAATG